MTAARRKFSALGPWLAAGLLWLAPAAPAAPRELPDFSRLVEKHGAAVVNISTTQRVKRFMPARPETPDIPDDHPFSEFFRRYFEGVPDFSEETSLGSGFIISRDGYILTCAHVVEDAREILVRLTDRREFGARLVGRDTRSDIAVLKIDAASLPAVAVGNPARLRVGEWVLAIGSPFGFDNSATTGIVSAKGRSLPNESYITFIQTDVAINPGNSGGPLFNLRGEVVGVNSQIYSRTGGFMGVSFAIPIDIAMRIGEQLKREGMVRRGWLGVSLQEVSRELAQAYGLGQPRGALIADILPQGPGAKSDLRAGDIVLNYEGQPVNFSSDLPPLVGQTLPGTRARLTVFRRGAGEQTAHITVGELKEKGGSRPPSPAAARGERHALGLALSELNTSQRKRLDIDHGVSVEGVEDGPARQAGLRPGDAILEVDGKRVNSVAEFQRLLAHAAPGLPVVLRVRRGAAALYLALNPAG
jgi:serine protease Do